MGGWFSAMKSSPTITSLKGQQQSVFSKETRVNCSDAACSLIRKRLGAAPRAGTFDRPWVSMRPSYQAKVGEPNAHAWAPRGLELTLSDGIVSALRDPVDRTREGSESEGSRSAAAGGLVLRGASKTNKEPSAAAKAVSDSGAI